MGERNIYLPLIVKFFEKDITTGSGILESMHAVESADILQAMPAELAIRVIKHLQIGFAAALLAKTDERFLQKILPKLKPQFLSTLLMQLPAESREHLRKHITGKIEAQVREVLEYPESSVGRVMTPDFLAFDKHLLAREAIGKIRALAKKRFPSSYAYMVDEDNRQCRSPVTGSSHARDPRQQAPHLGDQRGQTGGHQRCDHRPGDRRRRLGLEGQSLPWGGHRSGHAG